MAGSQEADTGRMRAASKKIESVYHELEAITGKFAERLRGLGHSMREQGIQRELDKVADALVQTEKKIGLGLLNIGVDVRQRAADIDSAVAKTQRDVASVSGKIAEGGKYGRELNR